MLVDIKYKPSVQIKYYLYRRPISKLSRKDWRPMLIGEII